MSLQAFSTELLAEAAIFLAEHGAGYPKFDAADAQAAVDLERALNQVVARATALAERAKYTILERRGPAVDNALALYAVLKAESRTEGSARATVTRMAPLVNTRKAPHQTKKQREAAKAKKLAATRPPAHE
jgi:hypothetical protein